MPESKSAVLEAAVPILAVSDLPEALDYYERILGFRINWKWGGAVPSGQRLPRPG